MTGPAAAYEALRASTAEMLRLDPANLSDLIEDFVANPQMMPRKPAAHPLVLQVNMEA